MRVSSGYVLAIVVGLERCSGKGFDHNLDIYNCGSSCFMQNSSSFYSKLILIKMMIFGFSKMKKKTVSNVLLERMRTIVWFLCFKTPSKSTTALLWKRK